jgi:CBS-domain-containing membrane protein
MRQVTVAEVMSSRVVTVLECTTFKEVARILECNHVHAVPVVDTDRRPVGIVTASDLLARFRAIGPRRRRRLIRAGFGARRKCRGVFARDLMTAPPITIGPRTPVEEAARLAAAHRIRSLPVVDPAGVLIGIVTRGDLLKVYLRADADIGVAVEAEVLHRRSAATGDVRVSVRDGVVTLSGSVSSEFDAERLARAAESVPGVVAVRDELDCAISARSSEPNHPTRRSS